MKLFRLIRFMMPDADESVFDTLALEPPLLAELGERDLFFLVVILMYTMLSLKR